MISKRNTTTALALSLTFAGVLSCFAQERIVKFTQGKTPVTSDTVPVLTISNGASKSMSPGEDESTFIRDNTFTVYKTEQVYTKKEVEGFIQPLRDSVSQHEKELVTLKAAIKSLADTNDALTKHLNETDAKLKELERGGNR